MHNEFDDKGMTSVSIVLLTHKMTATFEAIRFTTKQVTPELVCDEVEQIGFDCELAGITEISAEDLQPAARQLKIGKQQSGSFASDFSLDSFKVRGEDDEEDFFGE